MRSTNLSLDGGLPPQPHFSEWKRFEPTVFCYKGNIITKTRLPSPLRTYFRATVRFRIVGRSLPGLRFGRDAGAKVDRKNAHVGVQRRDVVVERIPGNAARAAFDFPVEVVMGRRGKPDFRGPFVHGRKDDRFLYLSWGEVGPQGNFAMFRRAKLPLSRVDARALRQSLLSGASPTVRCSLDMTDERGGPICGPDVGKKIAWEILA